MRYFFTTLAINEQYLNNSIQLFCDIHQKTSDSYFNITTSQKDIDNLTISNLNFFSDLKEKFPRLNFTTIESFNFKIECPTDSDGYGFTFNVNMKCLSFKSCLKLGFEFDYILFVDGDWNIHEGFNEEKIKNLFSAMESKNLDFVFERPARIGDDRLSPARSFYNQKIHDYDIHDVPLWDEAHVCNEQFLVFKNNWKFKVFVQKWEQMMWYSIANRIRNYAEGFEIGICALESSMNWNWFLLKILNDCFNFKPKYTENIHVRF